MNKIKIIALFGKSCAGKDTIARLLSKTYGYHFIISGTTRPPRDYEKNGKDYYFYSEDEFSKLELSAILEQTKFNGWNYFTPFKSLSAEKINVGVFNIQGIQSLLKDERVDILPIYIEALDRTRLDRAMTREKDPDINEINRRLLTDDSDFSELDDKILDYKVIINDFPVTLEEVCNKIEIMEEVKWSK